MILWIALFLLVLAISFVLAYRSMRDFHLTPTNGVDYGLFLIKTPKNLTEDLLDYLRDEIFKDGLIISFERLFKGKQAALVIFGPKNILIKFSDSLNLLELEDYTKVDENIITAWEVGLRDGNGKWEGGGNLFENMPQLEGSEQFWWQVNIKSDSSRTNLDKNKFLTQIRCVCLSKDLQRRKKLVDQLARLGSPTLSKVPKPFTSEKILEFYKMRALSAEKYNPNLTSREILQAIKFES